MFRRLKTAHHYGGRRYTFYVLGQIVFATCTACLGILTLLMQLISEAYYPEAYDAALFLLKVGGALAPYLVLDSLFWWYKRREGKKPA